MGESLTTHTTPATALANSEQAAEPDRRASRFDQRGIALQTVIILVVMLAIAGTVAAVLLSRAGDVTSEMETQDITRVVDTPTECADASRMGTAGAGTWTGDAVTGTCKWEDTDGSQVTPARCRLAGGTHSTNGNKGVCETS